MRCPHFFNQQNFQANGLPAFFLHAKICTVLKQNYCVQEEKTARETAEAERAELLQSNQAAVAELQRRLGDKLSAEESAHRATRSQLTEVGEREGCAQCASRCQQKHNCKPTPSPRQKRQSQFEQQKGALEASSETPFF